MTTTPTRTLPPYRSALHPAHAGFGRLLRAEWTKFWTVRAWLLVLAVAAVVTVVVCQLGASGSSVSGGPTITLGPDGEVVNDSFRFTHRPLTGDGTVTTRVTGLKDASGKGLGPWTKAGIIVKSSLKPGSPYAAVMATSAHGVRMQWNFTHDTAGPSSDLAKTPQWLRLKRLGEKLTGYASVDGENWTRLGEVRVGGWAGRSRWGCSWRLPSTRSSTAPSAVRARWPAAARPTAPSTTSPSRAGRPTAAGRPRTSAPPPPTPRRGTADRARPR